MATIDDAATMMAPTTSRTANPRHPQQQPTAPQKNQRPEIPYNGSTVVITLIALLSPLATLGWAMYHVHNHDTRYEYYDDGAIDIIGSPATPRWLSYQQSRHLQDECIINNSTSISGDPTDNSNSNNGQDTVHSTWAAVSLTFYIAGSVGLIVLFLFETFRRDPIVGKYVYDRKRLVQPGRTPPPLMLSRSLWRGHDDDNDDDADDNDNTNNDNNSTNERSSTCCKVRPALFEIFFLNLNEDYVRYSQQANDARIEREKRGFVTCCRSGCYHDNCCCHGRRQRRRHSNDGEQNAGDEYVDDDGYVFYPGYRHSYSYAFRGGDGNDEVDGEIGQEGESLSSQQQQQQQQRHSTRSVKWHMSIEDLFPEDFRSALPHLRTTGTGAKGMLGSAIKRANLTDSFIMNDNDEELSSGFHHEVVSIVSLNEMDTPRASNNGPKGDLSCGVDDDNDEEHYAINPEDVASSKDGSEENRDEWVKQTEGVHTSSNDEGETMEGKKDEWVGKVSIIGKQIKGVHVGSAALSENTKENDEENSIADDNDNAIEPLLPATETTDNARNASGKSGKFNTLRVDIGHDEEDPRPIAENDTNSFEDPLHDEELTVDNDDDNNKSASPKPTLKTPSRLKSYFLPPGFHDWGNVWEYLGYLFYIPKCYKRHHNENTAVFTPSSPMNSPMSSPVESPTSNDGIARNTSSRLKICEHQIPLTPPERELLRCAGLDTYLMIRFARFGFDVTFYPFVVACVTVFPVYLSCTDRSLYNDTTDDNAFFSLTINRIPEGSGKIWPIVIFTILVYLFVLRRLWMEWEGKCMAVL